jgi:hypothetical protein
MLKVFRLLDHDTLNTEANLMQGLRMNTDERRWKIA